MAEIIDIADNFKYTLNVFKNCSGYNNSIDLTKYNYSDENGLINYHMLELDNNGIDNYNIKIGLKSEPQIEPDNKTSLIIKYSFNIIDEFKLVKELSHGSYGKVYLIVDKNNNYGALKKPTKIDSLYKDIKILHMLKTKKHCPNSYLNSVVLNRYTSTPVILMPAMDGTLVDFKNADVSKLINIMIVVVKHVECLVNFKLYYTDIKETNILYKCLKNNNYDIIFGDLGSITDGTLPTSTSYKEMFKNSQQQNILKYIVWVFGIMILSLIMKEGYNINNFLQLDNDLAAYANIDLNKLYYSQKEYVIALFNKKIDSYIHTDYKILMDIIIACLHPLQHSRPSLATIKQELEELLKNNLVKPV